MNTGDKWLHINACFKLPKDFDGDLNDALQALLDYRRGPKDHNGLWEPNPELDIYENFWTMIHESDRVLFGGFAINTYNKESNTATNEL
jgi:hypothetical protein